MKFLISFVLALSLLVSGCTTSQQSTEFKTISAAETAVSGAFSAYIDLVAQGQLTTNSVPTVSKAFNLFQQSAITAINLHNLNPASPPPADVANSAAAALSAIAAAKGSK